MNIPVIVWVISVAVAAPFMPHIGISKKFKRALHARPSAAYTRKCFWLLRAISALLIIAVANAIGMVKSRMMYDAVAGRYSTP